MRIPLLARFPRLRWLHRSVPLIPEYIRHSYPELTADFAVLDREVTPAFMEYDDAALLNQNRYRRQQVVIVLGAVVLAGLGGLQAVFPALRWPGVLLAVLGIVLVTSTYFAREGAWQTEYLNARVKAERLRALHFQYLSATGRYAGPGREDVLRSAVLAICRGEEPE